MRIFIFFVCIFMHAMLHSAPVVQNVALSAGTINGLYYTIGGSICRLVNKNKYDNHVKCSLESTPATIFNINMLREKKSDFAIMQGDWEYYALQGQDYFEKHGPFSEMRALFSLHQEVFTLIVRKNSPINTLNEIIKTRLNLNSPGSGVNATFNKIMKMKGWVKDDFKLVTQLKESEQAQALCDGKVDVIGYFVGHPNAGIQELSAICDIKILPIADDSDIKNMIEKNNFYFNGVIPAGLYANSTNDIDSFGVYANFLTRADTDDTVVYNIVKSVFENMNNFRLSHKILGYLQKEQMANMGYSAKLHKGAEKYFREQGLLKDDTATID